MQIECAFLKRQIKEAVTQTRYRSALEKVEKYISKEQNGIFDLCASVFIEVLFVESYACLKLLEANVYKKYPYDSCQTKMLFRILNRNNQYCHAMLKTELQSKQILVSNPVVTTGHRQSGYQIAPKYLSNDPRNNINIFNEKDCSTKAFKLFMSKFFSIFITTQLYGFATIKKLLKKEQKSNSEFTNYDKKLKPLISSLNEFSKRASKSTKNMLNSIFSEIKLKILLCSTLLEQETKFEKVLVMIQKSIEDLLGILYRLKIIQESQESHPKSKNYRKKLKRAEKVKHYFTEFYKILLISFIIMVRTNMKLKYEYKALQAIKVFNFVFENCNDQSLTQFKKYLNPEIYVFQQYCQHLSEKNQLCRIAKLFFDQTNDDFEEKTSDPKNYLLKRSCPSHVQNADNRVLDFYNDKMSNFLTEFEAKNAKSTQNSISFNPGAQIYSESQPQRSSKLSQRVTPSNYEHIFDTIIEGRFLPSNPNKSKTNISFKKGQNSSQVASSTSTISASKRNSQHKTCLKRVGRSSAFQNTQNEPQFMNFQQDLAKEVLIQNQDYLKRTTAKEISSENYQESFHKIAESTKGVKTQLNFKTGINDQHDNIKENSLKKIYQKSTSLTDFGRKGHSSTKSIKQSPQSYTSVISSKKCNKNSEEKPKLVRKDLKAILNDTKRLKLEKQSDEKSFKLNKKVLRDRNRSPTKNLGVLTNDIIDDGNSLSIDPKDYSPYFRCRNDFDNKLHSIEKGILFDIQHDNKISTTTNNMSQENNNNFQNPGSGNKFKQKFKYMNKKTKTQRFVDLLIANKEYLGLKKFSEKVEYFKKKDELKQKLRSTRKTTSINFQNNKSLFAANFSFLAEDMIRYSLQNIDQQNGSRVSEAKKTQSYLSRKAYRNETNYKLGQKSIQILMNKLQKENEQMIKNQNPTKLNSRPSKNMRIQENIANSSENFSASSRSYHSSMHNSKSGFSSHSYRKEKTNKWFCKFVL